MPHAASKYDLLFLAEKYFQCPVMKRVILIQQEIAAKHLKEAALVAMLIPAALSFLYSHLLYGQISALLFFHSMAAEEISVFCFNFIIGRLNFLLIYPHNL